MRTVSWRRWPPPHGLDYQSLLYLLPTQPEFKGNPRTQIMHTKYFVPHSVLSTEAPKGSQYPFPVHRTQPAKTQKGFVLGCEMVKGTPKSL